MKPSKHLCFACIHVPSQPGALEPAHNSAQVSGAFRLQKGTGWEGSGGKRASGPARAGRAALGGPLSLEPLPHSPLPDEQKQERVGFRLGRGPEDVLEGDEGRL